VFRNRRLACLILGIWLGASVFANVFPVFRTAAVAAFIAQPGSTTTATQIKQTGAKAAGFLLRRFTSDLNALVLTFWEWAEVGIAVILFLLVLFAGRPPRSALILLPAMLAIVLIQLFVVTPQIASAARDADEFQGSALIANPSLGPLVVFQRIYTGTEILKLLMGCGVAARLMVRRSGGSSGETERGAEQYQYSRRRYR
jgi:hypothetical protein